MLWLSTSNWTHALDQRWAYGYALGYRVLYGSRGAWAICLPYAVARPTVMMEKSKMVATIKGTSRRAPAQVWLEWLGCMLWGVHDTVDGGLDECWVEEWKAESKVLLWRQIIEADCAGFFCVFIARRRGRSLERSFEVKQRDEAWGVSPDGGWVHQAWRHWRQVCNHALTSRFTASQPHSPCKAYGGRS